MALLIPFLNSTLLFSSISPDFKKYLWDELISCEKYIGIPHDSLMKMPIYLRKFYISKHNESVREEKERMKQNKNKRKK